MTNELKTKLAFNLKNMGVTIHHFENLKHRAYCAKVARLLAEETHPLTRSLLWSQFKRI